MIGWQNPAAFLALAIVSVPVIVHLLRRHRAERVLFPSLRFVRASQTAAVRLRPPADWVLLVLRVAVLALAVSALAGPVVLTESRMARWSSTIARAVIVDASDSMRTPGKDGATPAGAAAEAAVAEITAAAYSRRFEVADLHAGLAQAARWLESTPPSRKEIVVISDFQRGAIDAASTRQEISRLNESIGLRLSPVGQPLEAVSIEGAQLVGSSGTATRKQAIDVTPDSTALAVAEHPGAESSPGLRLIASPRDDAAIPRLLSVLSRAGTPAGSSTEPIVVRFAGAPPQDVGSLAPVRAGWMLRTVTRLRDDPDIKMLVDALGARVSVIGGSAPWTVVVRDGSGEPLVSAAAAGEQLIVDAAVPAETLLAASVVRGVLAARLPPSRYDEREIARTAQPILAALSKPAGPVDRTSWRAAQVTDARWCWAAGVALLALEQWVRSRRRDRRSAEVARAA